ncbi:TIR-like protein FxsC [Streptomyces sp. ME19-03-3]|nr:TIR-like protein FxsC [Streptomyces sp. ME19-03-3]
MPDQDPSTPQGPSPVRDALGRLVSALGAFDRGLDAVAIAEALWVSAVRPARDPEDLPDGSTHPDRPVHAQSGIDGTGTVETPIYDTNIPASNSPAGASSNAITVSRRGALPRAIELTRALRPLKRPWPNGRRRQLDIATTIDDYARTGELLPVFRPGPERWFDLTVVIDRSPSMAVWQSTIAELSSLLRRLGAFRVVRICQITEAADGSLVLLGPQGRHISVRRVASAQGRSLLLFISDCSSWQWRSGQIHDVLRSWATTMSVVLCNPMPQRLWRHVGLDLPAVRAVPPAGKPGVPNAELRFVTAVPEHSHSPRRQPWLPLPVTALTPRSAGRWARTLMRAAPSGCDAVLLPPTDVLLDVDEPDEGNEPSHGAGSRNLVDAFVYLASPQAVRLAVLCTPFDPVPIPVLRLIQQELVPTATVSDIAEVIAGGLLNGSYSETSRELEFRYHPQTRTVLQKMLSALDAWQLNDLLTHRITTHATARAAPGSSLPGTSPSAVDVVGLTQAATQVLQLLELESESESESEHASDPEPSPSPPLDDTSLALGPARGAPTLIGTSREDRPYFFLSYAHTPRNDPSDPDPDLWIAKLYNDLCAHILQMTTLPAGVKAGFMDRGMNVGEGWPKSLAEALAHSRVFVPLYSPRYFRSQQCGKEWYAFSQRAVHHRSLHDRPISGIVPALWVPVAANDMPGPAEGLQFNHADLGEDYATEGFYGLIKLSYLKHEYERAVYRLAQRIIQVGEETKVDPGRGYLDYHQVPSAFGPPGASRPLHITVLACSDSEGLPEGRSSAYYGPSPRDWNPYHPQSSRPLADLAADLARNLDYHVSVGVFEDELDRLLDPTPTAPTLLLLDRWALRSPERHELLQRFGSLSRPWVSTLVPWNREDPESQGQEEALRRLADEALNRPQAKRSGDVSFIRNNIPSLEMFCDDVPRAVGRAAKHYAAHAPTFPPERPRSMRPTVQQGEAHGEDASK